MFPRIYFISLRQLVIITVSCHYHETCDCVKEIAFYIQQFVIVSIPVLTDVANTTDDQVCREGRPMAAGSLTLAEGRRGQHCTSPAIFQPDDWMSSAILVPDGYDPSFVF